MSAYICDPRTIDYLVTWTTNTRDLTAYMPDDFPATAYDHARSGNRLNIRELTPNEIGQILLDENVRSVSTRYPRDTMDTMPGPIDQSRVVRYRFQPVSHQLAAWVVKAADCLRYQSCETDDYDETLAAKLLTAIRDAAIRHLTVDAPWGVTDEDIAKHTAEIRAKTFKPGTLELA